MHAFNRTDGLSGAFSKHAQPAATARCPRNPSAPPGVRSWVYGHLVSLAANEGHGNAGTTCLARGPCAWVALLLAIVVLPSGEHSAARLPGPAADFRLSLPWCCVTRWSRRAGPTVPPVRQDHARARPLQSGERPSNPPTTLSREATAHPPPPPPPPQCHGSTPRHRPHRPLRPAAAEPKAGLAALPPARGRKQSATPI